MRPLTTLVLLVSLTGVVSAETPKPRLTVYPRVAIDAGVRIEAFVPREPENRRLRVEMDGPLFRAFEEELEGEGARALFSIYIDQLPEGKYVVKAEVWKANGSMRMIRTELCRGSGCFEEVL